MHKNRHEDDWGVDIKKSKGEKEWIAMKKQ